MERLYQLSNLCCAACAAKMEYKIRSDEAGEYGLTQPGFGAIMKKNGGAAMFAVVRAYMTSRFVPYWPGDGLALLYAFFAG